MESGHQTSPPGDSQTVHEAISTPATLTDHVTVEHNPTEQNTDTVVEELVHPALVIDEHAPDRDFGDHTDTDSAYGSGASTANTASLASSIYNYKYENGRRYHAYREGTYVLPNDEPEQERLDLQHHMWRLMVGGALYTAPLSSPERILDLGTGTGIWAIEMADEFPDCEVRGIDLSPIQPGWVPPNCKFHVDDYDGEWTYMPDEAFDFIHGRALGGTTSNWTKFYRQVFENLKPGGWCEMQEYDAWIFSDDDSVQRATWTMEWISKLDEASQVFNKQIDVARHHKQWMIDAGFVDVQEQIHRIPIGPWAKNPRLKELGRWERTHMQMSVASYTPALFSRVLGWTEDQISVLIENVKNEFRSRDYHLITSYRFITGRRPEL